MFQQTHFVCIVLFEASMNDLVCVAGVVEVLKGMQELDVAPDIETLSVYSLPAFSSIQEARQALKVVQKPLLLSVFALKSFYYFNTIFLSLCSGRRCVFHFRGLPVFRDPDDGSELPGRRLHPV